MGVKAENRYHDLNKRQIDAQYLKEEGRVQRMFDKLTHAGELLEEKNNQLQAEIDRLSNELEHARQAYERRNAECQVLKDELAEEKANIARYRELWLSAVDGAKKIDHKHQKLSAIVRLALSPEKYHEYRRCIEEDYPEFRTPSIDE